MSKYLFPIIVSFILISCVQDNDKIEAYPDARNGVLDLRDWNFTDHETAELNGEWAFYWEDFYRPEETPLPEPDAYFEMPGVWNDFELDGEHLDKYGYATFRLEVLLPDNENLWGLQLYDMFSAYEFYINGKLVSSNGIIGTNRESYEGKWLPREVFFDTETNRLELLLLIANFEHRRGGMWHSIIFGTADQIHARKRMKIGFDLFLVGSLLIISLYHLGLFIYRKSDPSTLFFSIFCVFVLFRIITTGEYELAYRIPQMSWQLTAKLEYFTFYLSIPIFVLFIDKLYPKFVHIRIKQFVLIFSSLATLIVILTPIRVFTALSMTYQIYGLVIALYVFGVIIKAFNKGYKEAIFIIFGSILLIIGFVNDVLFSNMIINTFSMVPLMLFLFIFFQSLVLSIRFSNAYHQVEELTVNLEHKVRERTYELEVQRDLIKKQNDSIMEDLRLARQIQMQLIPKKSPLNTISFYYKPMMTIGGDFFDFIPLPDGRIGVFISDVSGHGVPAAFVTSMIKSYSFQYASEILDPAEYLFSLNDFLLHFTAGNFVTAFYGFYDPKTGNLIYSNAGHNHPYIITPDNSEIISSSGGLPLAIYNSDAIKDFGKQFKNDKIKIGNGEKLFLYTDGMMETVNKTEKDILPGDQVKDFETLRFQHIIRDLFQYPCDLFVKELEKSLIHFRGGQDFEDDVCMICIDSKLK